MARVPVAAVFFLIVLLALSMTGLLASAQEPEQESLGGKYCGGVEPIYGIQPEGTPYARVVGPRVAYIEVTGMIDYAMVDYVRQAIAQAEADNSVLVIMLNTPGGYLDAALEIVAAINDARVPVVGYVVDKWAESAGTLILVSTDIAAMQPGTIIGSMQPVAYDPATGAYQPINESKIINPIIQVLCEHGASKGRNATALVRFVLFNDNYGSREALQYGVIDYVATDLEDLISQINGDIVKLPSGDTVRIELDGSYYRIPPSPRVVILHTLSDPVLAGVLLSLGMLIVLFSMASGHYAGAAVGALLLILGMAGSGFNPNTASLLLIALGALLVVVEIYTPGFGIIGGTGIVMLVLGIALLPLGGGGFAISPAYADQIATIIYAIGGFFGVVTAFIIYKIIQVRRRKPILWSIEGAEGVAIDDLSTEKPGFVIVEGEYWKAVPREGTIPRGARVRVVEKRGPVLVVEEVREGPSQRGS